MSVEFTQYIDLAQVTLYAFWVFFAGLVYWLRMEDRREGYPLESDTPYRVGAKDNFLFPEAKLFYKPEGGTYAAPNFERDTRPIEATRSSPVKGSPLLPNGDPLLSGVGPASYAQRHDEPELTREGHHAIVPMRVAKDYSISAGPDPRGFALVLADGTAAGTIVDLWVDRAEMQIRYLEVEIDAPTASSSPAADAAETKGTDAKGAEESADAKGADESADDKAADESADAKGADESAKGAEESADAKGAEESAAAKPVDRSASAKTANTRRLVPITVVLVDGEDKKVRSSAIHGHQLVSVPTTRRDDSITVLEEERIQAFYAGGYLYADAQRAEPLV